MVLPSSQWFGSGFGQNGSTSNRGACVALLACACAAFSRTDCPTPNAVKTARNPAPTSSGRFINASLDAFLYSNLHHSTMGNETTLARRVRPPQERIQLDYP